MGEVIFNSYFPEALSYQLLRAFSNGVIQLETYHHTTGATAQVFNNLKAFQVVIEVGHKASTLKEPIGNFIYKWNLFLRSGDERQQIDKVVQKVVFNLHETFKNPVRECTQPPYCVKENGYGEFEFPIDIYFNGTSEKYTILYLIDLPPADSFVPLNRFRKEVITFVDPNPEFRNILIESGASIKKLPPNTNNTSSSNLKKKHNSSTILNSSLNTSTNLNTSQSSPNSSQNSSKLSVNGSSFLASHSVFPSEKKKNMSKKSLIRNDLSNQNPKLASLQNTPSETNSKPISNSTNITPPKKQQLNNTLPSSLLTTTTTSINTSTPNNDQQNENKAQFTKQNSSKSLVKIKSNKFLNTLSTNNNNNNDELDKLKNEPQDLSNNLTTLSKKRPFVQSNESIQTDSNKLDENKKISEFKKIKSSNKLTTTSPPVRESKPKDVENENEDDSIKNKKNKKFKNDLENHHLLSPLQSTLMTPPPSLNTNGTNSCTSSVSSSCNYNTSPSSLTSLCLNKEQTKLKTKTENSINENLNTKSDDFDRDDLKKNSRRRRNSSSSGEDDDEYRKERDRDRDKHRRSSNNHHNHRRNYKRRNSNDYENDSDADYYNYKNSHYKHLSRDRDSSKSKPTRNGTDRSNINGKKLDDDDTSSTVSTLSNSSSSNDKNYKKYSDNNNNKNNSYSNKQPTNHNRDSNKTTTNKNDANYRERMLNLYDKILHVCSNKQIDLLAKICGLVRPFSFTENQLFNFDLFTLDLNVVEKLESLVFESSNGSNYLNQNGNSSSLDTSNKKSYLKSKDLAKT